MKAEDLEQIARRHGIELLLEFGSMVTGRSTRAAIWIWPCSLTAGSCPSRSSPTSGTSCSRSIPSARWTWRSSPADPLFLRKITERCRLLFGPPRRLAELKIYAFKRYQDHHRYLALEREYVHRTLERLSAP